MNAKILLIIKSPSFRVVKDAAQRRGIHVFDIAVNGGNLNEFRALTDAHNFRPVQRWFAEEDECQPRTGYPAGTLLFFRLISDGDTRP